MLCALFDFESDPMRCHVNKQRALGLLLSVEAFKRVIIAYCPSVPSYIYILNRRKEYGVFF